MSNLKNLNTALEKAKNVKEVFTLDFVADRAIQNYQAVTGRKDANNWYQTEVLTMMSIFAEKPELAKADKMSIWGCLMTAGRLGLSIADGHLDLVPYNDGKILKAEPNYKGMREQLRRMPEVKEVYEAQVVCVGDEFEHDPLSNKVTVHKRKGTPTFKMEQIVAAYVRIEMTDGTFRDVVMYQNELVAAKNKSKNKAEWGPWNTHTGEMCKKSVVKRAKKIYHRPSQHEIDDAKLSPIPEQETQDTDYQEASTPEPQQEQPKVKEELPITPTEEVKEQPKKQKTKSQAASNASALLDD